MLQCAATPLFHASAIISHISGRHVIKDDNAECFHSWDRVYPAN